MLLFNTGGSRKNSEEDNEKERKEKERGEKMGRENKGIFMEKEVKISLSQMTELYI